MDTLMSDPHVAYTTPLDIAFMVTGLVALVAVGVYRGVSWNFAKNDFMNKCFYLLIIFNGLSAAKVIFGGFMTVRDYNTAGQLIMLAIGLTMGVAFGYTYVMNQLGADNEAQLHDVAKEEEEVV